MRFFVSVTGSLAAVAVLCAAATGVHAQKHNGGSPPTAPPAGFAHEARGAAPQLIAPVSMGLGSMEFLPVNAAVSDPQSLARQLQSDDEHTRQSALASLGVPGQYLAKGRVPYPHTLQLEQAALSNTDELDALLTVEMDKHLVTAVMIPANGEWRRIATMIFPTSFADPSTMPSTFLRTKRSLLEPVRYRAVFHARESQANGDFIENEAHMRIVNNRAIITSSFVSAARQCITTEDKPRCEITQRWLQLEPTPQAGVRKFLMVTGTGQVSGKELQSPLLGSWNFETAHLRAFTCQPFTYSEATLRYEPTGTVEPCAKPVSH